MLRKLLLIVAPCILTCTLAWNLADKRIASGISTNVNEQRPQRSFDEEMDAWLISLESPSFVADYGEEFRRNLFERARERPIEVLQWINKNGYPYQSEQLLGEIVALVDPRDAIVLSRFRENITHQELRRQFDESFLGTFADTRRDECMRYVISNPDVPATGACFVLTSLLRYDSTEMTPFLAAIEGAPWAGNALKLAFKEIATENLERAWQTAEELPVSAEMKNTVLAGIATSIMGVAPDNAAMLANNIPYSKQRLDAMREIMLDWAKRDPQDVGEWMKAHLDDAERNLLVSQTIMLLGSNAPKELWPLIDTLPTWSLREKAVRYAVPQLPKGTSIEEAFTTVESWGAPTAATKALVIQAETMAAYDLDSAVTMINDERFPGDKRIESLALAIIERSRHETLDLAETVKNYSGDSVPRVAEAILDRQEEKLPLAMTEALRDLVLGTSRESK